MRLRRCGVSLLAACALVLAGCGGSGSRPAVMGQPIDVEQLARSASTSAAAKTGLFALSVEASLPGTDEMFAFGGEGAYDSVSGRARFSFDLGSLAKLIVGVFGGIPRVGGPDFEDTSQWQLEVIQDGDVTFMRFPALASELPAGRPWVRMRTSDAAGPNVQGFDLSQFKQFVGEDRGNLLGYLRAVSGEVETIGSEELRGAPTTHYRGSVDMARYGKLVGPSADAAEGAVLGALTQAGLAEAPFEVWLDDQGLVRKLQMSFTASQPGSTDQGSASLTFEVWSYGEPVDVELPPASQVVAASALRG